MFKSKTIKFNPVCEISEISVPAPKPAGYRYVAGVGIFADEPITRRFVIVL